MATPVEPDLEIVLTDTVVATANYAYLLLSGVTCLDVSMSTDRGAFLGIGLFDGRGHDYQSPGFRGLAGAERQQFFVALDGATLGFIPGLIEAGSWTVMIPVFLAVLLTRVTVRVRMTRRAGGPGCSCLAASAWCGRRRVGTGAISIATPRPARTRGLPGPR